MMPLFRRAVEALLDQRAIATTMHVLGGFDAVQRVLIIGASLDEQQTQTFNVGRNMVTVAPRGAILVMLAELPRSTQLALAGQYGEHTNALVVSCMERDRRPRCIAQPFDFDLGQRVAPSDLGGHLVLTPPPDVIALLGRFWDGVESGEKAAAERPARSVRGGYSGGFSRSRYQR